MKKNMNETNADNLLTDKKLLKLYFARDKDLKLLTTQELKILKLYYGLEDGHMKSLIRVGEKLNLSRERIRQIKYKAMRKIIFFLIPSLHDIDTP